MLLVPPEPWPKGRIYDENNMAPPPWWRRAVCALTQRYGAIVRLPCRHIVAIGFMRDGSSHTIAVDGTVSPSVVCPQHRKLPNGQPDPQDPEYHDFIRLLDWTPK